MGKKLLVCPLVASRAWLRGGRAIKMNHALTVAVRCSALLSAEGRAQAAEFLALLSGGDGVQTSSQTFEDMPGLTAFINTSANPCVMATFSAGVASLGGAVESIAFRAVLDDVLMEGHADVDGDVRHRTSPPGNGVELMVSYTFWKCDVLSDAHTVKIQWRSVLGNPIAALGRTLTVLGQ
jgi:hypothetical protein